MQSIKQLIQAKNPVNKNKYISREYQDYGYRLAAELGDLKHKTLYIKLAKEVSRALLEQTKSFVIGSNARNRGHCLCGN